MDDRLTEVINACTTKTYLNVPRDIPVIDLITLRNLGERDIVHIRSFQRFVRDHFGIDVVVVGGGFGCGTISITVRTTMPVDKQSIQEILNILLSLDMFRDAVVEIGGFNIAVRREVIDGGNERTSLPWSWRRPETRVQLSEATRYDFSMAPSSGNSG